MTVTVRNRFRVVCLGLLVGGFVLSTTWTIRGQEAAPHVALTYDILEQVWLPDGNLLEQRKGFARRSDGSTVEIFYARADDGAPMEMRHILDLATRKRTVINSHTRARTTYHISPVFAEALRSRHYSCSGGVPAAGSTRLGYEVVLDEEFTQDQRLPRRERLLAPGLGCVELELRLFERSEVGGSERLLVLRQAENLRVGEPDPALFRVPDDYAEMSPREYFTERVPDGWPMNEQLLQRLEDGYLQQGVPAAGLP